MAGAASVLMLPLFVGLTFSQAGCNTYNFNQDPLANATVADVMIKTDPAVLDFGQVAVNASKVLSLSITNQSERALQIESIELDRPAHFELEGESAFTLDPLTSTTLRISYRPIGFEAASANLVINSSDPILPKVTVGLAGRCDPPRLDINPLVFSFGETWIGCGLEQPLYIKNLGGSPLNISRLALQTTSSELALDLGGEALPLQVAANTEREIMLRYTPLDETPDSATLILESDDPDKPQVKGSYAGQGRLGGLIRDEFNVADNGKVDILFVVDNSGSMEDNQTTLASNFDNFYFIIDDLALNWQIGVVTTDNAVLQGIENIITPDTADVRATFKENAMVGTGGSGSEQGLEFAYQALSEPIINAQNRGFLRPEAGLHVIILSDEEDQSPRTVDFYVSYFESLKLSPSLVKLSAITGNSGGCNSSCGSADAAPRYAAAVSATGGIQATICECNFISALEQLAEESVVIQDTYPLSQTPVISSIQVTVNDAISSDWHYDGNLNSVVFNSEQATPPNGANVVITYDLRLTCND